MQHEINDATSKKSKLEDALLEIMEAIDKSKEESTRVKTVVKQEQARFAETEQKLKQNWHDWKSLLKEAEAKRGSLTGAIDPIS